MDVINAVTMAEEKGNAMVMNHTMTPKNYERTAMLLILGLETLVVVAEKIYLLFVMLPIVKARCRCVDDDKCTNCP